MGNFFDICCGLDMLNVSEHLIMCYHFSKNRAEEALGETKTKQGNSYQMQFFLKLLSSLLLLSYHPRRLHCCFIRRDLASSKSSNSFSDEQPTPRPAACSCLLWLLSKKKLMGQTSQGGAGTCTWCKDVCYETKPFCFEDKMLSYFKKQFRTIIIVYRAL